MPTLQERIQTALPIDDTFAFIADFANASRWDPGVAWSERVGRGPLAVGTAFRLGIRVRGRVAQMEYRITVLEPSHRVVLTGDGFSVTATDDIRFEPTDTGTRIDYTAEIRLRGALRLVEPFAGDAFATIARNARAGMQRTLDEMARDRSAGGGRA